MEQRPLEGGNNTTDISANNQNALMLAVKDRFAVWNKLILKDLHEYRDQRFYCKYTKEDIIKFLKDPRKYERQLRRAVIYIYDASPHFRRLIQYFTMLSDLSYIVEAYRIDPKNAKSRTLEINYRKALNALSSMSIKTQFSEILTVCLREDVYYGTMWVTTDSITIQRLPSDYCKIRTVEGNVPNVTFDFAYFDDHPNMLEYYPEEFRIKYDTLRRRSKNPLKWIELDSPTSFAIKCNSDILQYAIPPFIGILGELYGIDDYKRMALTKTAMENYALLAMTIPLDKDDGWLLDFDKAKEFWYNLNSVLPDAIGSVLTPMPIDKISFERNNAGDSDTVTKAEQNLFTAAGVSSQLFNNSKASANALLLSIKVDQGLTYGIVKKIQDMVNRYIQSQKYGKNFRVNFLDVSPFNRKEVGDAMLKAASYGMPTISAYAASQGIGQAELDSMSFLEGSVLKLPDLFRPLRNSSQMSSADLDSNAATDEGGAPTKDIGELTDSGEQSREDGDDWG